MSLKTTKWLASENPNQVIIVDCRYNLVEADQAAQEYAKAHIPFAHFVDLEVDLCGPKSEHGGRHPLPSANQFANLLSRLGWESGKEIIAYDSDGSGAAHFWWLAQYFSIDTVSILQGGFQGWLNQGLPITSDSPRSHVTRKPTLVPNPDLVVTRDFVLENLGRYPLLDSRSYDRFMGYQEPIDKIAGRIPGSSHFDYKAVYVSPGEYHSLDTLRQHFASALSQHPQPVVYCGSGVSACANIFALHILGVQALLYAGSFSDWISYPDSPIERGEITPGPRPDNPSG